MTFKERLRKAIDKSPKERKAIASDTKIPKRTIDKWLEIDDSNPSAIPLVNLSVELGTVVEYLVLGEKGRDYVLEWAIGQGVAVHPPQELAPDVQLLCELYQKLDSKKRKKFIDTLKLWTEDDEESGLEYPPQAKKKIG